MKTEFILNKYIDEDGIRITMITKDKNMYLPYLWKQVVGRLMNGIRPDADKAIELLQEKHPQRLSAVIEKLNNNYSIQGLRDFEASLKAGFRKIGAWNG